MSKPNVLFIMVDELRFPVQYESKKLRKWSKENLKAMNYLRKNGQRFVNHYVGSTACAPSRATIFTGQYPSLHGVSQTDGLAKYESDPDMYWLDPATVPTLGTYFERAGYQTYYKGKWHISEDSNINIPGTHDKYLSYSEEDGVPDREKTKVYLRNNRLSKYGFNDYVGPEPHGSNSRNSGSSAANGLSGRDVVYGTQVSHLIQELDKDDSEDPWFIVASFVNPHDIVLYGELSKTFPQFNFDVDPSVPFVPPAPTANEDLSTKPQAQQSYKETYQKATQLTLDTDTYRRLYYSLQLQVDKQIQKVLDSLNNSKFTENTLIVFTSDHGDLLGAHGLFQKWYNAYEESIHVDCVFAGLNITPGVQDILTSHVDLVPTILSIAGIPAKPLNGFTDSIPFVGRDLSPLILGTGTLPDEPVFFMTNDNATKGLNQTSFAGVSYRPVVQPNSLETVIVKLSGNIYKYTRYYDNPRYAGFPRQGDVPTQEQAETALDTPSEYEAYNLTEDPYEQNNLVNTDDPILHTLRKILRSEIRLKKKTPISGAVINFSSPLLVKNRMPPAS